MPRNHHFFVFRHCLRSTSPKLDPLGVGDDDDDDDDHNKGWSRNMQDYLGDPLPQWGVGVMQCTVGGKHMAENAGAWLIESGTIDPGRKIKWEFIAHDVTRDVETAKSLARGVRQGLHEKYGKDGIESVGDENIQVHGEFFEGELCDMDLLSDERFYKDIEKRLETVPRPPLSFQEGLELVMRLAGTGSQGNLSKKMNLEPEFDREEEMITGAANFLCDVSETLFYARASGIRPRIAANATAQEIVQLFQFNSYYRSIKHVDTTESAIIGALQAQIMLRVLRIGYFNHRLSGSDDEEETDDNDNYLDDDDDDADDVVTNPLDKDDYDTTVTIFVGHDDNLDTMATALGVRWILKEPYVSGPGGALLPTPPMSAIHAVRNADSDQIDMSFVYPMYASHETDELDHFRPNKTGILEHTPLLFQKFLPFSSMDEASTTITSPHDDPNKSSLDVLEDHLGQVVSGYGKIARVCHYLSGFKWGPPESDVVATTSRDALFVGESSASNLGPLFAVLLFFAGIVIGRLTKHPGSAFTINGLPKSERAEFTRLNESGRTDSTGFSDCQDGDDDDDEEESS